MLKILELAGETQAELAQRLGVSQPAVSRWVRGKEEPDKANHSKIISEARRLGILSGSQDYELHIPEIVGYVGAGAAIIFSEGQGPFGTADMPPLVEEPTVAVVVQGDSMSSLAEDGSIVYFSSRRDPPTPDLIGKLCVVGLSDGRVMLKKLYSGSHGRWNLISIVGAPMLDQQVAWAARVEWIHLK